MPELVFFRRGEEVLRVGLERERLVNRHHLVLRPEGGRCVLEDLSGQGTQVAVPSATSHRFGPEM